MKFFTVEEIIYSVIFSLILGIIFGCTFSAAEVIFSSINKLIFSAPRVYRKIESFSKESIKEIILYSQKSKLSRFNENLRDAILFSIFGIATLILVYITLDGIFRLYVIATLVMSLILAKKTVGKLFSTVFIYIFNHVYKLILYAEYLLLYPIYIVLKFLKEKFLRLWQPINIKLTEKKMSSLINKKINEIKKYNLNL